MADSSFVRGRSDFTNAIKTIRSELYGSERGKFRFANVQVRAGEDIFCVQFSIQFKLGSPPVKFIYLLA